MSLNSLLRLSLFALILLPSAAHARDVFVDNVGGDDRHDGGAAITNQESGPCRSIRKALALARRGDRIVLANRGIPYEESVTLEGGNNSGSQLAALVILGNGAILSGARPVPDRGWEYLHDDLFAFEPQRKSYQQLFIDQIPVDRVYAKEPGKIPPLKPREWTLADGRIIFRVEKDRLPQSYRATYAAGPVGLTLYNVENVMITDLVVEGFQLDGISAIDNCRRVSLVNVTSRGNGRAGVNVGGSSRVAITNCLIGNNGTAQVRVEEYSEVYLADNDLLENPAPKVLSEGGRVLWKAEAK